MQTSEVSSLQFPSHFSSEQAPISTELASMEILSPSPPPSPSIEHFSTGLRNHHGRIVGGTGAAPSSAAERVHVAVGRSPEKTLGLLRWAFRRFGCTEVVLVHVHQPSLVIPTLLGKIPANQATEELVKSHRRFEKQEAKKILSSYIKYCHKSKVQASVVAVESDQIQSGIINLVTSNGIRKLIMGSAPDNCFKFKGGSNKATLIAKYTPPFCEIWFVSKGRHIWTREASIYYNPDENNNDIIVRQRTRFSSSSNSSSESDCDNENEPTQSYNNNNNNNNSNNNSNSNNIVSNNNNFEEFMGLCGSPPSWPDSPVDNKFSPKLISKDFVYDNLKEVMTEAENSRTAAFTDLVKRKEIENQIFEILNKVQATEASQAHEAKQRQEAETLLKQAKEKRKILLNQKEKAVKELESEMTKMSLIEIRTRDLSLRQDEADAELEALQSAIEFLQLERTKSSPVKELRRLSGLHVKVPNHNYNLTDCSYNNYDFREFSLSDIQTATCNFSESFKLGQGGNGCVYKGEIMNRTVVIKKLHPHNVHGSIEFQREVYVLSKLRHPNLVKLYGACPEALCIVYEYLPNGTLQNQLSSKRTMLTWRTRSRLISEISNTLLFLHSSKIIHGDLKPDNVLLDSEFRCKICEFGISSLVPDRDSGEEVIMFRRSTDPALLQGDTKSDVYFLGIIVLQLLTGKSPLGLPNEVRGAVMNGQLASILDGEWPAGVAKWLVEFGLRCCEMNGRDRPDLTAEIVRELEQLHLMKERPVPSFFLCPILQEIMSDPQVAADGFTYEGKALRDWLEKGRETSPMTNLKLEHLNLTPNHALRFAIQDWLCQS
ncbi:hypothetical protein LUZ60_012947 [Juncus effusus]|nr:hypothetical protein LUZ60_012947 [Juncus effusus]